MRCGNPILRSPEGRSDYGRCNEKTYNGTNCFSARQRYFVLLRLFFAYFFLARQKKVCRRRHSYSVAVKMGPPVNPDKSTATSARSGGQHPQGVCRIRSAPSSLTAARGRPPLQKVRCVPNFIRQIFNGRKRNDSHNSSCAQETRFDGRPSGRSDYERCNDNTQNVTMCFFARKRYFVPSALFFHIFSRKREKIWSPKAQCGVTAKEALR